MSLSYVISIQFSREIRRKTIQKSMLGIQQTDCQASELKQTRARSNTEIMQRDNNSLNIARQYASRFA